MTAFTRRVLIYIPTASLASANNAVNGGAGPNHFHRSVERISDSVVVGSLANWQMTESQFNTFRSIVASPAAEAAGVRWLPLRDWNSQKAERVDTVLAAHNLRLSQGAFT